MRYQQKILTLFGTTGDSEQFGKTRLTIAGNTINEINKALKDLGAQKIDFTTDGLSTNLGHAKTDINAIFKLITQGSTETNAQLQVDLAAIQKYMDKVADKGPQKALQQFDKIMANASAQAKVHLPTIRQKELERYNAQWPDLKVSYNTLIEQFAWTFVNKDGTILDVQYIDKGGKAVDPITRAENPIPTPTAESTVSTDFTFKGWDTEFTTVFGNQTVTALYTESVRKYTVRYLNRGAVLKSVTAPYGSTVLYDGDMPVYTGEETAYKYYLFNGWDKSGYVTGDKDINAVYDSFEYTSGCFDGREIGTMRPVEIYAMKQVGVENSVVSSKDPITITMGTDFSYDDIEEKVFIDKQTDFTGKNYVDTGVKLLDEDRNFVLAVDYRMQISTQTNSVLMQCYESNGMNGFRLWMNSGCKLAWGTASSETFELGSREMLVLRHVKGENGLHVYSSNMFSNASGYQKIERSRTTKTNATLVFGCSKADDGAYENYAIGSVYWAKVWYADLGEDACRELASWVHSTMTFEMAGFKRYYLSDNASKRCAMTFLASELLDKDMPMDNVQNNSGGWAKPTTLNTYLNNRLYKAMPIGWRQLIQKVRVPGNVGGQSTEIAYANCYFYLPSVIELDSTLTTEPYIYEGSAIDFITTNDTRCRRTPDGTIAAYWTRSPNRDYNGYYNAVNTDGNIYSYYYPTDKNYVLVEFSI